ncbi:MAG: M15 family metallopeptidase [Ruminococcus sp.]|nr:M15 family metallopeptidase [Ruminococcus sp.]
MDYLMLVDKFNAVPENYEKTIKLIEIQGKRLESQACRQCDIMLKEAKESGVVIRIISAYRTKNYQQMLWEQSICEKIKEGFSLEQAENEVSKTLAKAGHSEHNAGLAIDFGREESDDVEDDFYKSSQAKWLCKNADRFGFILRYPRLKEHITGISYEPWHYRYVGTEAAQFIKKSGLCLEEFLHFYSENYI